MNHFTLFAHGSEFDVDAYLRTTSLTFDKVWHRGDVRGHPELIQDNHPTSGVEKVLGPGRELSIFDQDRIAADFLEANESELKALAAFSGIDTVVVGLHFRVDLTPGLVGFCTSASVRLAYFALRIGVTPTFYINLIRHDFDDE